MFQNTLWTYIRTHLYNSVIRIHESHIFVLRKIHFKQMKIITVYTQLKQLRNKAWKKFRPERESNPWPLRYRCSALTNWAIKPTGSWSIVSSLYTRGWTSSQCWLLLSGVIYCLVSYNVRKSYSERLLISLEKTVSLAQWWAKIKSVVGLSKFIEDKYRTAFRSRSLLTISLFV